MENSVVKLVGLLGSSFMVALSGALMPGPLTISAVERAMRYGAIAAVLVALGHSAIELPTTVVLAFGLHLANVKLLKVLIGIIGGSMIILMGISMLRTNIDSDSISVERKLDRHAQLSSISAGVISSLSNPYWSIWWLTVGASMIGISLNSGMLGVGTFYIGHILGDILWLALIGIAIERGVALLRGSTYKVLIRACGVFMVGFGCAFIFMALKMIAPSFAFLSP
ncbi:MAG: LysE family translocator [Armatimonadetes bacterium]|nr:LysE family translocator [Armatimonadota bacterium]